MSSPDQLIDKLTIETPEQTSLEFPLAGIGSRFLALALDTLIQFAAIFAVLMAVLATAGALRFWPGAWTWPAAVAVFLLFCLYYGYFAFFETIWNGQTPGKRFMRLRVIQESGRPITVYQAIGRNLLRIVDQLPGFYAIGIVAALISRQNRRLGDYVAGTVVVHEKPFEEFQPAWESSGKPAVTRFNAARLGPAEIQLMETFLQRRAGLSPEVRAQMAHRIAEHVARKMAIAPDERSGPNFPVGDEAFLEALAEEHRNSAGYR